MHMGYGFYWHPGQKPFLATPGGDAISFLVNKDIPYLAVGTPHSVVHKAQTVIRATGPPAVERPAVSPADIIEQVDPLLLTEDQPGGSLGVEHAA